MDPWASETCCACMVSATVSSMYSLSDPDTMQLFRECTNILYQEQDGHQPHHLCLMCYKQCEMWKIFKTRCEDTRRLLGFQDGIEDVQEILDDTVDEVIEEEGHHGQYHHRLATIKAEVDESNYEHFAHDLVGYDPLSGGDTYGGQSPHKGQPKKRRKEAPVSRGYGDDADEYKPEKKPKGRMSSSLGNVSKVSHNLYMKTYRDFQRWKSEQGDVEIDEELMLTYFHELSKTIAPSTLTNKLSHLIKMIEDFHQVKIDGYQRLRQFCREVRYSSHMNRSISEVEVVLE